MKRLCTCCLLLGALGALAAAVLIPPRVGHPVTPWMSAAAAGANGRAIVALPGMTEMRPTIVVFILPGCPCSEEYEPCTHELFRGYGTQADILGIVAGSEPDAVAWREAHSTPYPLIADPDGSIARSFGAERSAYTALVLDGKTVDQLWPGYSAEMLEAMGSRVAAATRTDEVALNFTDAPRTLTSGCALEL